MVYLWERKKKVWSIFRYWQPLHTWEPAVLLWWYGQAPRHIWLDRRPFHFPTNPIRRSGELLATPFMKIKPVFINNNAIFSSVLFYKKPTILGCIMWKIFLPTLSKCWQLKKRKRKNEPLTYGSRIQVHPSIPNIVKLKKMKKRIFYFSYMSIF